MKIYYYLTQTNHIGNVFFSEQSKTEFENSYPTINFNFIEKTFNESEVNKYEFIKKYSTFLKVENNEFILDESKYNKNNLKSEKISKLKELKNNLINTDYKVIKCYEASLLNEEMPYDLQDLLVQRKAWREQINQLEFEISMLG